MKVKFFQKLMAVLLGFLISLTAFGQTLVKGTVLSDDDNKPVEGASVIIRETSAGTQTDANGQFSLTAKAGQTLVFSSTGFVQVSQKVSAGEITVRMKRTASKLDEVVVIGYGTQRRREFTGASTTIRREEIKYTPTSNVTTVLQGSVPGMIVQQTTGQPGSTPSIAFRGGTQLGGGGSPMYIVDGIYMPTLYGLSMNDVETIDILKDAATTAIYGARAANGVVLITTKKGKKGKSIIQYGIKYTNNQYRSIADDYLSAADYIRMNRIGIQSRYLADSLTGGGYVADRGQLTSNWGWAVASGFTSPIGLYTTQMLTNNNRSLLGKPGWSLLVDANPFFPSVNDSIIYKENSAYAREAMLQQNSQTIEHNLNVSGANEKGAFALGITAMNDVGTIIGSQLKRLSINFNGALNVNDKLKVGLNAGAYSDRPFYPYSEPGIAGTTGATGGLIQRFLGVAPTVRYTNDTSGAILPGPNDITLGNPDYWSTLYVNRFDEQRFSGGINAEWTLLPYLKLLTNINGWMRYGSQNYFTKVFQAGSGGSMNTNRSASFSNYRDYSYTANALLQADKTYGQHKFSLLGGGEYYEYRRWGYSGFAQGAPTDLVPWLTASTSPSVVNGVITNPAGASSGPGGWDRLASLIGRLNYTYADRYLVNGVLRYDGSSRLYGGNVYNLYPGVSFGWNLHNEKFFTSLNAEKYITSIKPRFGYGLNGNLNYFQNNYFPTDLLFNNAGIYNGQGGYYVASLVNQNLKWESVSSMNLGVDLGLLNNRISIIADYFVRNVYDKLYSMPISAQTGFTSMDINLSKLQNRGVELDVEAKLLTPVRNKGVNLSVRATYFSAKSYIKKLANNGLPGNRVGGFPVWDPSNPGSVKYAGALIEGERDATDEVWAPMWDGIYTSQAQLTADANVYMGYLPYSNKKFKQMGDAKWHQVYKNDTIDSRQFVFVGRTRPKATGSFALNSGYQGFSLHTKFDYAYGFVILNNDKVRGLSQVQGSQNSTKDVLDTWSPNNPNGNMPRFYWANQGRNYATDASGNNPAANLWEKGDYLMLREITLAYEMPQSILSKFARNKVKGLNFSITGSNLKYFTKYSGTFPEVGGFDNGRYSLPRRMTFAAQITF